LRHYETDIPTIKQKEKEQARFQVKDGQQERQESACQEKSQGARQDERFRRKIITGYTVWRIRKEDKAIYLLFLSLHAM
jgi:hypothetical protein